jgi:hypothetical protein
MTAMSPLNMAIAIPLLDALESKIPIHFQVHSGLIDRGRDLD